MGNEFRAFIPFSKFDDEQRIVGGIFTSEAIDSQGEIIDFEATKAAVADYSQWRNIREMHQPSAVGVAETIELNDVEKSAYTEAKVVDASAWEKVKSGVYKGFSIGGTITDAVDELHKDDGGNESTVRRITGYVLKEISLVDRPANPDASFVLIKRDEEPEELAKDDAATEEADAMSADQIAAALKQLIIREISEDGTVSYDVDMLIDALRSLQWFAEDERWEAVYDAMNLAAQPRDLKKGDDMTAIEELNQQVAGLVKAVEAIQNQGNELAKVDFGALAKAEDVVALREQLAKVDERLVKVEAQPAAGGPVINPHAFAAMAKSFGGDVTEEQLAKAQTDLEALDARIAKADDPYERQRLGQERALMLMRNPSLA